MRKFISILAGLFAGSLVVFIVEKIGHTVYPLPEGIDPNNIEAFKEYAQTMPVGAMLFVILAWALGAFAAGIVTTLVGKESTKMFSLITGGILMLFGLINLIMIPHPVWFAILGMAVYLPFAYLGHKLIARG